MFLANKMQYQIGTTKSEIIVMKIFRTCQFLAEDPPRMSRGRIPLVSHLPVSAVDVAQQNFD